MSKTICCVHLDFYNSKSVSSFYLNPTFCLLLLPFLPYVLMSFPPRRRPLCGRGPRCTDEREGVRHQLWLRPGCLETPQHRERGGDHRILCGSVSSHPENSSGFLFIAQSGSSALNAKEMIKSMIWCHSVIYIFYHILCSSVEPFSLF